jgi:hypothetical protein
LLHNWPYLLVGVLISAFLKLYLDANKISAFLKRFRSLGVLTATGAAVATPLCSCGTTAVILGMLASTMPWSPIVAFMVASPLTSPEELLYSAGLFGWPFALAFFAASILLGLLGGATAAFLESRGWLANQTRFSAPAKAQPAPACACSIQPVQPAVTHLVHLKSLQPVNACACAVESAAAITLPSPSSRATQSLKPAGLFPFLRELYASGKQLLPMFLGFTFIGYLINGLIPASWVAAIFGGGNVYSVPLAATLALPLYINTEGSLPLVRALLENGMSQGAALAFLISGSGTSIGAMAGALTIARWRVVGLVIGVLWVGAILSGYAYDLLLTLNLI